MSLLARTGRRRHNACFKVVSGIRSRLLLHGFITYDVCSPHVSSVYSLQFNLACTKQVSQRTVSFPPSTLLTLPKLYSNLSRDFVLRHVRVRYGNIRVCVNWNIAIAIGPRPYIRRDKLLFSSPFRVCMQTKHFYYQAVIFHIARH